MSTASTNHCVDCKTKVEYMQLLHNIVIIARCAPRPLHTSKHSYNSTIEIALEAASAMKGRIKCMESFDMFTSRYGGGSVST